MIKSRNLTSHIYDESVANEIAEIIEKKYFLKFQELLVHLNHLLEKEEDLQ